MSAKITAQDLLTKADQVLKPRVATLISTASSFQANDGADKALIIHNNTLSVKEAVEMFTRDVLNVQRPVSVEDGTKVLKLGRELQVSWNIAMDHAVNKKPIFDALPVGNITALIAQDLKANYAAMQGLANALVDAAPAELLAEAKAVRKEYEDAIKKVIAIYQ